MLHSFSSKENFRVKYRNQTCQLAPVAASSIHVSALLTLLIDKTSNHGSHLSLNLILVMQFPCPGQTMKGPLNASCVGRLANQKTDCLCRIRNHVYEIQLIIPDTTATRTHIFFNFHLFFLSAFPILFSNFSGH